MVACPSEVCQPANHLTLTTAQATQTRLFIRLIYIFDFYHLKSHHLADHCVEITAAKKRLNFVYSFFFLVGENCWNHMILIKMYSHNIPICSHAIMRFVIVFAT